MVLLSGQLFLAILIGGLVGSSMAGVRSSDQACEADRESIFAGDGATEEADMSLSTEDSRFG
jgi:hypothetical protein